jgi:hypothetical protein
MLLPLPLYLCWSYLCFFASQLGCAPVARLAGSTVMEHFVVRTPSRPLWEAHPADAERLDRKHADKAALPLLRATVHVAFLWVGKLATPALDMPPRDQRTLYLEDQVVRLKAARRLGTALQVSFARVNKLSKLVALGKAQWLCRSRYGWRAFFGSFE